MDSRHQVIHQDKMDTSSHIIVCDACRTGVWCNTDKMFYCGGNGCNVAVHESCYGIKDAPRVGEKWLCAPCKAVSGKGMASEVRDSSTRPKPRGKLKCILCNGGGGALKKVQSSSLSRWAHVSCVLAFPETGFRFPNILEEVTGHSATNLVKRRSLRCVVCSKNAGACLQCSVADCDAAFHPRCAMDRGLQLDLKPRAGIKHFFCPDHVSQRVNQSLPLKTENVVTLKGVKKILVPSSLSTTPPPPPPEETAIPSNIPNSLATVETDSSKSPPLPTGSKSKPGDWAQSHVHLSHQHQSQQHQRTNTSFHHPKKDLVLEKHHDTIDSKSPYSINANLNRMKGKPYSVVIPQNQLSRTQMHQDTQLDACTPASAATTGSFSSALSSSSGIRHPPSDDSFPIFSLERPRSDGFSSSAPKFQQQLDRHSSQSDMQHKIAATEGFKHPVSGKRRLSQNKLSVKPKAEVNKKQKLLAIHSQQLHPSSVSSIGRRTQTDCEAFSSPHSNDSSGMVRSYSSQQRENPNADSTQSGTKPYCARNVGLGSGKKNNPSCTKFSQVGVDSRSTSCVGWPEEELPFFQSQRAEFFCYPHEVKAEHNAWLEGQWQSHCWLPLNLTLTNDRILWIQKMQSRQAWVHAETASLSALEPLQNKRSQKDDMTIAIEYLTMATVIKNEPRVPKAKALKRFSSGKVIPFFEPATGIELAQPKSSTPKVPVSKSTTRSKISALTPTSVTNPPSPQSTDSTGEQTTLKMQSNIDHPTFIETPSTENMSKSSLQQESKLNRKPPVFPPRSSSPMLFTFQRDSEKTASFVSVFPVPISREKISLRVNGYRYPMS